MTGSLPISFLSDYGHEDEFAGVCHGVIQRLAPGTVVVDVTHGLPPHDVEAGAVVLRNALPFLPEGVHLAIVDPGVGSERRAIAARAGGRFFVGPDNGLLSPALERCGGADAAVEISNSPFRLEPVSATFHGRDLFAPVAARLASGASLEEAGTSIAPGELVQLELPVADMAHGRVSAHVLYIDRFGNAQLNVGAGELAALAPGARLLVDCGEVTGEAVFGRAFADAAEGQLLVHEDSYGQLALAANRSSAASALGLERGSSVTLRLLT